MEQWPTEQQFCIEFADTFIYCLEILQNNKTEQKGKIQCTLQNNASDQLIFLIIISHEDVMIPERIPQISVV